MGSLEKSLLKEVSMTLKKKLNVIVIRRSCDIVVRNKFTVEKTVNN